MRLAARFAATFGLAEQSALPRSSDPSTSRRPGKFEPLLDHLGRRVTHEQSQPVRVRNDLDRLVGKAVISHVLDLLLGHARWDRTYLAVVRDADDAQYLPGCPLLRAATGTERSASPVTGGPSGRRRTRTSWATSRPSSGTTSISTSTGGSSTLSLPVAVTVVIGGTQRSSPTRTQSHADPTGSVFTFTRATLAQMGTCGQH